MLASCASSERFQPVWLKGCFRSQRAPKSLHGSSVSMICIQLQMSVAGTLQNELDTVKKRSMSSNTVFVLHSTDFTTFQPRRVD